MIEVRTEVEVPGPAGEVFSFVSDMSNNPRWQKGMQHCRWTTDPPLRVGSTYDQVARFLGKEIVSSFEVTELEDGRRIRIRSTSGPMPIDVTREVTPVTDDRTRVTAVVRGDPSGLFRIAAPVMRWLVRRSVRGDYERLAELLDR